jgi:putative heme-binding domain-containing protein
MICELIANPAVSTVESLALIRALDFQNPASVNAVLPPLVAELRGPDEKVQVIRPELVRRPEATAATTTIATRIVNAADGATVPPLPLAKDGKKPPRVSELLARTGNPVTGKGLFAGAGTCAKCHIVNGEGKAVGPNLSGIGAKLSREALYESILAPSAAISHSYETFTARLKDGRSFTGLLISQSPEKIVIRGADSIDVILPAGEVEELVKQPISLMPADLATTLSPDELVDLVAWLETLRATQ